MTKHKHAEMIKAKADNMDLVVFANNGQEWMESGLRDMVSNPDLDFFVCLPKNAVTCFKWLNGCPVQVFNEGDESWVDCVGYSIAPYWCNDKWMMSHKYEYRIKPRKEKRWIIISNDGREDILKELPDFLINTSKLIPIEIEV